MITTVAEYKLFLEAKSSAESSYDERLADFKKVLASNPELSVLPIELSPDRKPISKIYRTVRQGDLFDDVYGTHGNPQISIKCTYVHDDKPMPELPKTRLLTMKNVESESADPEWNSTTDWTIDPGYYYQVHDEVIRICLDFNKVKALVGHENILNLLHDGEAEIRLRNDLPLLQLLDSIEILEEAFEEDMEGEYGVDRAINTWFPEELMPYLKLVDHMPFETPKYSRDLAKYYEKVYAEHGATPVKPYGNTWIDQK